MAPSVVKTVHPAGCQALRHPRVPTTSQLDPVLAKNKQNVIRKAHLDKIRAEWYARCLANNRKGKGSHDTPTAQSFVIPSFLSGLLLCLTAIPCLSHQRALLLQINFLSLVYALAWFAGWLGLWMDKFSNKNRKRDVVVMSFTAGGIASTVVTKAELNSWACWELHLN